MATAGRVLLMPKDNWIAGTSYEPLDFVYYGGNTYVCKIAVSGDTTPDNDTTHWQNMASGFDMTMITQTITNEQNKIASDAAVYAETVKLEAQDAALAANMATVETTSTASKAYTVGEQLVYQNLLYKAKVAIAAGETFAVGTNIERTTEGAEITAVKESLSNKIKIHTTNATSDANSIIAISSSMLPSGVNTSQILQITTTSGQGGFFLIPGRAWTYLLVRSNLQLIPSTTIELKITYYEL